MKKYRNKTRTLTHKRGSALKGRRGPNVFSSKFFFLIYFKCLQIVEHLTQGESDNAGSGDGATPQVNLVEAILEHSHSVEDIENDMASLQVILNRQNTLKPIFGGLLSSRAIALKERKNASQLRRLLSEAMFDYSTLEELWNSVSTFQCFRFFPLFFLIEYYYHKNFHFIL